MAFIDELISQRQAAVTAAQRILAEASAENRITLTPAENRRFDAARADIERINDRLAELGDDVERRAAIEASPVLQALRGGGGTRTVNTAGRLSPLAFPMEELRRAHAAALRGEGCEIRADMEKRFSTADSLLPAQLFPYPTAAVHENRLLDRLPGFAIELPQIEYVQHTSTTGSAASVAEGALKPEITLNVTKLLATAVKLAGHLALSREIIDDWDAFYQYAVGQELFRQVIDTENDQILKGDGTGTDMTGFFNTTGILTHDCSTDTGTNVTVWDSLEISIAALRSGSALAEPDLAVFNPTDWSAIRRVKDAYGRFLVAPDPSDDQVNEAWGVPVLVTTWCPTKQGLFIDTTKMGRVAIREPLSMRIGYANDDLTRNLLRFVAEERLVLTVERPAAVLKLVNLP
jgi:HK97 family phage major capsid protein